MENQEIEIVKDQTVKAFQIVEDLQIVDADSYTAAIEVGGKIKQVGKIVTDRKEAITKPLNESLKSIRALFKPLEDMLGTAESNLKRKMLAFKEEERRKIEAAEKLALEEIHRQNALLETKETNEYDAAVAISEANAAIPEITTEKTMKSVSGFKATEKMVKEYVVTDKSLIPLGFMEPDMVAIKAEFKAGRPVPGVEVRDKAQLSF